MGAVEAVLAGRIAAEALFVDSCTIRAPSTFGAMDPDTGLRTETLGTTRYTGRCKVQTYEPFEQTPQSGEHVFTVQRYAVHIPASAAQVQVNDVITITAATLDSSLVGRRYRVAGLLHKSMATAQRLLVDEVTA